VRKISDLLPNGSPPTSRLTAFAFAALLLVFGAGIVQRILTKRSGVMQTLPSSVLPSVPQGLQISVSQIRPDPQNKYQYNVPAMVESFFPEHVLSEPRRITGPGGTVMAGHTSEGQAQVQACIMATGRSEVDLDAMLRQDQLSTSSTPIERIKITLVGALTGYPRSRRPCWLVQLSANARQEVFPPNRKQQEDKLVSSIWPVLESLRPTLKTKR